MFTVYEDFTEEVWIFYAAIIIYGLNVFVRIIVGIYTVLFPAEGSQLVRVGNDPNGSIRWGSWLRLIFGMLLIMLEPVAGIRLLNSAFEAKPPMTQEEKDELAKEKEKASDSLIESEAKIKEANEKEANANADMEAAKDLEDEASRNLVKRMADSRRKEVDVVKLEAMYLEALAGVVQEETDLKLIQAEIMMRARIFNLEQKRLKGTEVVEVIMAVFEDLPELGLAVVFAKKGGLKNATNADISLFVTSQVISLFHAAKCFWSFWTLRNVIRDAGKAEKENLDTHLDYISVRQIEKYDASSPASQDLEEQRALQEPLRLEVEEARRAWDAEFKSIEDAVKSTGSESLTAEIEKRKKAEATRREETEAAKRRENEKREKREREEAAAAAAARQQQEEEERRKNEKRIREEAAAAAVPYHPESYTAHKDCNTDDNSCYMECDCSRLWYWDCCKSEDKDAIGCTKR